MQALNISVQNQELFLPNYPLQIRFHQVQVTAMLAHNTTNK